MIRICYSILVAVYACVHSIQIGPDCAGN
jgi:hypothetical protein